MASADVFVCRVQRCKPELERAARHVAWGGGGSGGGGLSSAAEGAIVGLPDVVHGVKGAVLEDGAKTRDAVEALSMQLALLGADADPAMAMKKVEARLFALAQNAETPEGRAGAPIPQVSPLT